MVDGNIHRTEFLAMSDCSASAARSSSGQFPRGVSGNPAGRPQGSRNKETLFREALREGEAEAIARGAIEAALAGDRRFLLACLNLLFPRPRGRTIELDVPEGHEGDARAVLEAGLRAMVRGEVSPQEALDVARVVEKRGRAERAAAPVSDLYPEERTVPAEKANRRGHHEDQAAAARDPLGGV